MNKKPLKIINFFTLIEVIVALTILTAGIMGGMAIVTNAKNRMDKAYDSFFAQHMLSQAAEFYLLCGNKPLSPDFFPYQGYSASCQIKECSDVSAPSSGIGGNWKLVNYDISVRNPRGQVISEVKVDKLLKDDIFQQR